MKGDNGISNSNSMKGSEPQDEAAGGIRRASNISTGGPTSPKCSTEPLFFEDASKAKAVPTGNAPDSLQQHMAVNSSVSPTRNKRKFEDTTVDQHGAAGAFFHEASGCRNDPDDDVHRHEYDGQPLLAAPEVPPPTANEEEEAEEAGLSLLFAASLMQQSEEDNEDDVAPLEAATPHSLFDCREQQQQRLSPEFPQLSNYATASHAPGVASMPVASRVAQQPLKEASVSPVPLAPAGNPSVASATITEPTENDGMYLQRFSSLIVNLSEPSSPDLTFHGLLRFTSSLR